jgi:hypothetical protein
MVLFVHYSLRLGFYMAALKQFFMKSIARLPMFFIGAAVGSSFARKVDVEPRIVTDAKTPRRNPRSRMSVSIYDLVGGEENLFNKRLPTICAILNDSVTKVDLSRTLDHLSSTNEGKTFNAIISKSNLKLTEDEIVSILSARQLKSEFTRELMEVYDAGGLASELGFLFNAEVEEGSQSIRITMCPSEYSGCAPVTLYVPSFEQYDPDDEAKFFRS